MRSKIGGPAILANLITYGGGLSVVLYRNSVEPDADTVYADLTIASFSGYDHIEPTFDTPTLNGSDEGETNFTTSITFTCTDLIGGSPQVVYGAALIHNLGGDNVMLDWLHFAAPVTFENNGDFKEVTNWNMKLGNKA